MKYLFAFAAVAALASPAFAGAPYVGVELGIAKARSNDIDETVAYAATPSVPAAPAGLKYDDVFGLHYKHGTDFGLTAGYDFGWFRLEGELAQKRVRMTRNIDDDITGQFLGELNSALNRPSVSPDPGAPGLPPLTIADFQPAGTIKVGSAMVNTLFDFAVTDKFTASVGGGLGRSFARGFHDHDGALAGQYMVGARYALTNKVELGLKYRYLNSGVIKLDRDPIGYAGNPNQVVSAGGTITQTVNALVTPDVEGEFRTRSLLAGLTYNFR